VAVDACAAAGEAAGASSTRLLTQRSALAALGVRGRRPDVQLAHTDPAAYARALGVQSQAAELMDPHGLGGFWWLVQAVGLAVEALPSFDGTADATSAAPAD
jgi:SAM-dependent MidA family methyltransferase